MFWFFNRDIITVKTMQEAVSIIKKQTYQKKSLVLFDVDMTLVIPDHPAVSYPAIIKYYRCYKKILASGNADRTKTLVTLLYPAILVEKITSQLINELNIPVILFTACISGALGEYTSIKEEKYETLKKLGFDFDKTFSKNLNFPVFYKGILFSDGEGKKGDTLIAFLNKTNIDYEVIILIDDRKSNLKEVKKALTKHKPHIKFVGIEYQGALKKISRPIAKKEFQEIWENASRLAKM